MKWNDDYMLSIYSNIGFSIEEYPLSELGIFLFLQCKYHIHIHIWKVDNHYAWAGAIINENESDVFSEDFTEYKTFNDVVNAAIVESACYASLSLKK